jgi:hypothetical protein
MAGATNLLDEIQVARFIFYFFLFFLFPPLPFAIDEAYYFNNVDHTTSPLRLLVTLDHGG